MRFDIVTLMPTLFEAAAQQGVTGRAFSRGLVRQVLWNPRDYTHDVHRTVDDRPYGGGPGMVMKYEPLRAALDDAKAAAPASPVIYLSPQGRRLDQAAVTRFSELPGLILLCGRYEGIDERIIECCVDEEWSIGDYVLSGGEIAAMALMDAVIRLLPDVLGDAESAKQDSFVDGLLDCPHYTRPEFIDGRPVPPVLLSGDHEAIRLWRLKQALIRTAQRRPDLIEGRDMSPDEQNLLDEYLQSRADAGENRSE